MTDARHYCTSIVDGPTLDDKLRAPPADLAFHDVDPMCAREPARTRPARDPSIALVDTHGGDRLPALGALTDASARAACLAKFAHHELCAVELFAWAVLTFRMPAGLARALVVTLAEEQLHCRLYLERLASIRVDGAAVAFGALPLSDYFWKHTNAIVTSANPPLAFLCAMGLTLEQANLDFTLMYRDAFRAAGDEETARVIKRVHDDEVRHVALAALWVRKLSHCDDAAGDLAAYRAHAPFPFSLARAKGRRFDVAARKRALLSPALIDAVRDADPDSADLVTLVDVNGLSTDAIEATVARWPPFARARFSLTVLRPTSPVEDVTVLGHNGYFRFHNPEGLTVFRRGGGAVLAPAPAPVARVCSAWLIDDHGEPHVAGFVRVDSDVGADGHGDGDEAGLLKLSAIRDDANHVVAGTRFDESALERARVVVERACREGLRGPCAVSAVAFRGDAHEVTGLSVGGKSAGLSVSDVVVRGAVDFHAGFTIAHVAAGVVARTAAEPGQRVRFVVARGDGAPAAATTAGAR